MRKDCNASRGESGPGGAEPQEDASKHAQKAQPAEAPYIRIVTTGSS